MYYIVYKITNRVNGKFYIGTHKTVDLNDNYMGSGKYLKHAIQKHGVENFTKEILFTFDNPEDMFAKEAEIVTEDFLAEENTYNLKVGGFGGFDYLNSQFENPTHKSEHIKKMNQNRKEKYPNGVFFGKTLSDSAKEKISKSKIGNANFRGKRHKPETIEKMKKSFAGLQSGANNSQYSTVWVTNGETNRKIKLGEICPTGFKKGRVIKRFKSDLS